MGPSELLIRWGTGDRILSILILSAALLLGLAVAWIDSIYLVVFVCAVLGLLLFVRQPYWAVLAVIFFDRIEVGVAFSALPLTLSKGITILGIFVLFFVMLRNLRENRIQWGVLDSLVMLFLLTALISGFYSGSLSLIDSRGIVRLISFVALYFVVSRLVTEQKQMQVVVYLSIVLGLILTGYQVLEYQARVIDSDLRFGENFLAAQTAVAASLSLIALRFSRKRIHSILLFGLASLYFAGLLLSSSRGGLLAFVIASTVGILILRPQAKNYAWIVVLAFVGYAVLQAIPQLTDIGSVGRFMQTSLVEDRRDDIWLSAYYMVRSHPIWGIGYGQFPEMIGDYALSAGYIRAADDVAGHSIYVTTISETGIVGFAFFASLLALAIWLPFKVFKRDYHLSHPIQQTIYLAIPVAILTQAIHGFVNDHHHAALLWILLGLSQSLLLMEKNGQAAAQVNERTAAGQPARLQMDNR